MLTPDQFRAAMGLTTDRVVVIGHGARLGPVSTTLYINFINLPAEIHAKRMGGGAESENNRQMFVVSFKGDRCKLEHAVNVLPVKSLRGKTASPESIAKYLGQYINETAQLVPPRLTHSR